MMDAYGASAGAAGAQEHANPFREMEKRFQLHYDQVFSIRKIGKRKLKKGKPGKFKERPTDLSQVLDFDSLNRENQDQDQEQDGCWTKRNVVSEQRANFAGTSREHAVSVYTMERHPGFFFVRGFLNEEEVEGLAGDILTKYIEPPASSNHTKKYGKLSHLWEAAQRDLYLSETRREREEGEEKRSGEMNVNGRHDGSRRTSSSGSGNINGNGLDCDWSSRRTTGTSSAQQVLAKLRWVSLGPQFDWTNRVYRGDTAYRELPSNLKSLAEMLVKSLGIQTDYEADAALLNFYGSKDTLGGHKDDAELDLMQPLVSMSLGCDAIFLLGHLTKEEAPPTAMLVRSGDIVVLAGQARSCYHGVPRIFARQRRDGENPSGLAGIEEGEGGLCVQNYLANHRINVSIRMVKESQKKHLREGSQ